MEPFQPTNGTNLALAPTRCQYSSAAIPAEGRGLLSTSRRHRTQYASHVPAPRALRPGLLPRRCAPRRRRSRRHGRRRRRRWRPSRLRGVGRRRPSRPRDSVCCTAAGCAGERGMTGCGSNGLAERRNWACWASALLCLHLTGCGGSPHVTRAHAPAGRLNPYGAWAWLVPALYSTVLHTAPGIATGATPV